MKFEDQLENRNNSSYKKEQFICVFQHIKKSIQICSNYIYFTVTKWAKFTFQITNRIIDILHI